METNIKTAHKQKGGVVIGVILVIIILTVIGLGAFKAFGYATDKMNAGEATTLVTEIGTGVQEMYANSNDYSSISTEVVVDAGIVPKSSVVGKTIVTPWYSSNSSSLITVIAGASPASFSVVVTAIPSSACRAIGSAFLSATASSVSANGSVVTDAGALATGCAATDPATLTVNF